LELEEEGWVGLGRRAIEKVVELQGG